MLAGKLTGISYLVVSTADGAYWSPVSGWGDRSAAFAFPTFSEAQSMAANAGYSSDEYTVLPSTFADQLEAAPAPGPVVAVSVNLPTT